MVTIVISSILTVAAVIGVIVTCVRFKKESVYDTISDSGVFWLFFVVAMVAGLVAGLTAVIYHKAVTTIGMFGLAITPEQYMALDEEGRTRLLGTVNHVIMQ